MTTQKETKVSLETISQAVTQSPATSAKTTIHWAHTATEARPDLERKFEAMRARNWITDKMVQQYQKHWHCSREVALERLMAKTSQ